MEVEKRLEIRKAIVKMDYDMLQNITKEELIEYIKDSQMQLLQNLHIAFQSV